MKEFANEFEIYCQQRIKDIQEFLDLSDNIDLIVALTDKKEEAGFVYGESSFSGFFNDTGAFAYINLAGDKSKEYIFKGLMHELVHHLYKYYVYGEYKLRITWVDEGLAQFLSGKKYEYENSDLYSKFLQENLNDNYINLNELNHEDKSFGSNNGYNLSYIAVKYLYEKYGRKNF